MCIVGLVPYHDRGKLVSKDEFPIYWQFLSLSFSLIFHLISLWSIGHLTNALFHYSFLILRHSVGLLRRGSAHRNAATYTGQRKHRINTDRYPYLHCVGFEPTIPVFERAKTVYALDPVASVIGIGSVWIGNNVKIMSSSFCSEDLDMSL
jgi:hypothetical protein